MTSTLFRRRKPEVEPPSTDPIPLPEDETVVPCSVCGVAVPLVPGIATTSLDLYKTSPLTGATAATPYWTQRFAVCTACASHRAMAAAIFDAIPPLRRYGSVVVDRLQSVLVVLAVLGEPAPDPAKVTRADAERWLRHLAFPGIQWLARADDAPGHAHPFPFAFLTGEDHARLRSAYADLLADRLAATAPPVFVAPPPIDPRDMHHDHVHITEGCLLCGVGRVSVPANANPDVWTLRPGSVTPGQFGARQSPMKLRGYTCPTCTTALDFEGAFGPSAMERSVAVTLGLAGQWRSDDVLVGLIGWGGLVANAIRREEAIPAPNAVPWGHLGDLDKLRVKIERG